MRLCLVALALCLVPVAAVAQTTPTPADLFQQRCTGAAVAAVPTAAYPAFKWAAGYEDCEAKKKEMDAAKVAAIPAGIQLEIRSMEDQSRQKLAHAYRACEGHGHSESGKKVRYAATWWDAGYEHCEVLRKALESAGAVAHARAQAQERATLGAPPTPAESKAAAAAAGK